MFSPNITNIKRINFEKKAEKDISISRKETTFNILSIFRKFTYLPTF